MRSNQIIVALIIFAATLFACDNKDINKPTSSALSELVSTNPQPDNKTTSIDKFPQAIDSLKNINYFISGKDSIATSKDPTEFIEMNGMRYCFEKPFDKSDSGMVAYRTVDSVRKYHVAKNKYQFGPSANIIQITFPDIPAATKWFDRLTECREYQLIQLKPKTDIWLQGRYVYFIQTYYDPSRHILNQITTEFKRHIE